MDLPDDLARKLFERLKEKHEPNTSCVKCFPTERVADGVLYGDVCLRLVVKDSCDQHAK